MPAGKTRTERPTVARTVLVRRDGAFEVREAFHDANAVYQRHHHEKPSLFVVLSGRIDESVATPPVECAWSSAGYLPAGVEHRSACGAGTVHSVDMVLDPAWVARSGVSDTSRAAYASHPAIFRAAQRLVRASRERDAAQRLAIEELVLGILVGAAEDGGADRSRGRALWLRSVVEIMRDDRGGQGDLSAIAAAVGRHPAHVCREFRRAFGCPMFAFARMIRIERAAVLLRTTRLPLAAVALDTGFGDQAHFSRVFRSVMGVTPARYRACAGPHAAA